MRADGGGACRFGCSFCRGCLCVCVCVAKRFFFVSWWNYHSLFLDASVGLARVPSIRSVTHTQQKCEGVVVVLQVGTHNKILANSIKSCAAMPCERAAVVAATAAGTQQQVRCEARNRSVCQGANSVQCCCWLSCQCQLLCCVFVGAPSRSSFILFF